MLCLFSSDVQQLIILPALMREMVASQLQRTKKLFESSCFSKKVSKINIKLKNEANYYCSLSQPKINFDVLQKYTRRPNKWCIRNAVCFIHLLPFYEVSQTNIYVAIKLGSAPSFCIQLLPTALNIDQDISCQLWSIIRLDRIQINMHAN